MVFTWALVMIRAGLQGWNLPEMFQHLRHLLEARMGNRGKRAFIQVLRLLEAISVEVRDGSGNSDSLITGFSA